jgi:pyruvate carboxylase
MIETGEREILFQVNEQLRLMKVKDRAAIKDQKVHSKVDKNNSNQIGKFEKKTTFSLEINMSGKQAFILFSKFII